jgi:hypothetical protein
MRRLPLFLLLLMTAAGARSGPQASTDAGFSTTVKPILERRCQPCHFAGGKMYDKLPFDRPETIHRLGTTKLFTRIHDEKDRETIRRFLASQRTYQSAR